MPFLRKSCHEGQVQEDMSMSIILDVMRNLGADQELMAEQLVYQ